MKDKYPEIPWEQVSGMRNKMINEYFGVDISILWQSTKEDIPPLRESIEEIIKNLN